MIENLYEITALSRSGHHAIINWMIKNLTGSEPSPSKFKTAPNTLYVNQADCDINWTIDYFNNNEIPKFLFTSYENTLSDYTLFTTDFKNKLPQFKNEPQNKKRIIIIRDFYDNLASRIKQNEKKLITQRGQTVEWDIGEHFINVWKNYAKNIIDNTYHHIKFEDWLIKEKRNNFLLDIFGINEKYSDSDVQGTPSSFDTQDKNELVNRINQVEVPNDIKEIIRKDNELHYLIGKLNYKYIKL